MEDSQMKIPDFGSLLLDEETFQDLVLFSKGAIKQLKISAILGTVTVSENYDDEWDEDDEVDEGWIEEEVEDNDTLDDDEEEDEEFTCFDTSNKLEIEVDKVEYKKSLFVDKGDNSRKFTEKEKLANYVFSDFLLITGRTCGAKSFPILIYHYEKYHLTLFTADSALYNCVTEFVQFFPKN